VSVPEVSVLPALEVSVPEVSTDSLLAVDPNNQTSEATALAQTTVPNVLVPSVSVPEVSTPEVSTNKEKVDIAARYRAAGWTVTRSGDTASIGNLERALAMGAQYAQVCNG
jgi:hydrogenase maturation factor HypE